MLPLPAGGRAGRGQWQKPGAGQGPTRHPSPEKQPRDSRADGTGLAEARLVSPRVTASSPALLVQGDAVNATVGTKDVELPGLGQQLHVPHLVGAPVHSLGRKAEGNVTFLWHPGGAAGRGLLGAGASGREPRCPRCQVGQGPACPHPCRVKEEAARWAMLPPRREQWQVKAVISCTCRL